MFEVGDKVVLTELGLQVAFGDLEGEILTILSTNNGREYPFSLTHKGKYVGLFRKEEFNLYERTDTRVTFKKWIKGVDQCQSLA